jgi:hypothetical protein
MEVSYNDARVKPQTGVGEGNKGCSAKRNEFISAIIPKMRYMRYKGYMGNWDFYVKGHILVRKGRNRYQNDPLIKRICFSYVL